MTIMFLVDRFKSKVKPEYIEKNLMKIKPRFNTILPC